MTSLVIIQLKSLSSFVCYRSREMPTECPAPNSCGTTAQVWLNVGTNILNTGNITVDACVSWGFDDQRHNSANNGCVYAHII